LLALGEGEFAGFLFVVEEIGLGVGKSWARDRCEILGREGRGVVRRVAVIVEDCCNGIDFEG
jgi:hypothetical protein